MSSQEDTTVFIGGSTGLDLCSETVYSIQGLLLDSIFCGLFQSYQFKTVDIILKEDAEKRYPIYNFDNKKGLWEIEVHALIVLNGKVLITKDEKSILAKYRQEDIKDIYTINRIEAKRKYGSKLGKKGALIINTL